MSTPANQPQRQPPRPAPAPTATRREGTMTEVPATITFDSPGTGAVIDIGDLDTTVSNVAVLWDDEVVYQSTQPNASGQSSIPADCNGVDPECSIVVKLLYPGWTRPDEFAALIPYGPGQTVQRAIARSGNGG